MRGWRTGLPRRMTPSTLLLAVIMASSLVATMAALTMPARAAAPLAATISHGRFAEVPIRRPAGEVRRFVVWFVDGVNRAQREVRIAALTADGAMVALVDVRRLERALAKDGNDCIFGAGDVENFARYVQAYYRLPTYHAAIVLGDGEGAALAYALDAQARQGTLAGAVSVGFCPVLVLPKAICPAGTLKIAPGARGGAVLSPAPLRSPWAVAPVPADHHCSGLARRFIAAVPGAQAIARDGDGDVIPAVRAALLRIGARRDVSVPPPPKDLAGLPIVEIAARAGGNTDTFAIFVSGDGGWARFDHDVAAALAAAGVPVAGVDALRYFWVARTPQGFADDLDRIVRYYAQHWRRSRVLVIGFSQGADVLPAAVNRLPSATRKTVSLTALLSAGKRADFEFHLSNWLGGSSQGLPIAPEVARMDPTRTLCVYGRDDDDALCPSLPTGAAHVVALPGDHHMGNDQARLATTILRVAGVRSQP